MLVKFTITLLEHALTMFPNLLYFVDSWVLYKRKKGTPLFGPRCTPPSSWKLNQEENQTIMNRIVPQR